MAVSDRQALHENRIGRVVVNDAVPDEIKALLRQRMLVVEEMRCNDRPASVWQGYCADFAALELGMAAPEYIAAFTQHADGSLSVKFDWYR